MSFPPALTRPLNSYRRVSFCTKVEFFEFLTEPMEQPLVSDQIGDGGGGSQDSARGMGVKSVNIVTWNVGHHRGPGIAKDMVVCSQQAWPDAFICLQEVGRWHVIANTVVSASHLVLGMENCDCAILIPVKYIHRPRHVHCGPYFTLAVVGDLIIISAHILDHGIVNGRAESVYFETVEQIAWTRSKYPGVCFQTCLGVDANAQLSAEMVLEDRVISGQVIFDESSSAFGVPGLVSWFHALELSASNTFGSLKASDAWTWRKSRENPLAVRSQIDYLAVSQGLLGSSAPLLNDNLHPFCLSDHRPVHGCFQFQTELHLSRVKRPPSLHGFRPTSPSDLVAYQTAAIDASTLGLDQCTNALLSAAHSVSFSTTLSRSNVTVTDDAVPMRMARRAVDSSIPGTLARKHANRQLRTLQRRRARRRNSHYLRNVTRETRKPMKIPPSLALPAGRIADRSEWLADAAIYGARNYGDDTISATSKQAWYSMLCSVSDANRLDGVMPEHLHFFDVLQGCAMIPSGKGLGVDQLPGELIRLLPFIALYNVWKQFSDRFANLKELGPVDWKLLELAGIPKEASANYWNDFRWVGKISLMQKWFMRSVKPIYTQQFVSSPVFSSGFKKRACPDMVFGALRQLLVTAGDFGRPLILLSGDIKAAFDELPNEIVYDALRFAGLSHHCTMVLLREAMFNAARYNIPTAGVSLFFFLAIGIKQGGVECPDIWACVVDFLFRELTVQWQEEKLGALVSLTGDQRNPYFVWADNIFFTGNSIGAVQRMLLQASQRIT